MMELSDIVNKAIQIGEKKNITQIEAYAFRGRMRNVYVENSDIHLTTNNSWVGLGVKSVLDKRVGFMSGVVSSDNDIEKLVDGSISLAKLSPEDKEFVSLPTGKKVSSSSTIGFDKELLNLPIEELVSFAKTIVNHAEKDGIKVMNGLVRINDYTFHVVNSLGVDATHSGTFMFVHYSTKIEKSEGVEKAYSARFKDLDPVAIGEELYRKTMLALNAKPFKGTKTVTAIIKPVELEGMINSSISVAVNGEHVNKKRSPWVGKLNQAVASDLLTIKDNPSLPEGPRSSPIDDEGVPTKEKALIEKGILKSYVFDSYNGNIAKVGSTGNGFRRGTRSIEDAYQSQATCRPSNLEIIPGNKTLDQLISEVKFGVIIEKFAAPNVDGITGNFGLEIRSAVLIENGELTQPIKHALLIGNFYKGLMSIFGVAKEARLAENVKTPAIGFEGFQLVGK